MTPSSQEVESLDFPGWFSQSLGVYLNNLFLRHVHRRLQSIQRKDHFDLTLHDFSDPVLQAMIVKC